jgi:glycosyltransferase involved in cell wall biosynthesis
MAAQPEATGWVERLGLQRSVVLLPNLPQARLWDLFHRAAVFVSPGAHDGTPNSLLEGMACGCFPIAGDIESLREWVVPGVNGLLFDPADPAGLSGAVCLALAHPELRASAAEYNQGMLLARASREGTMDQVDAFYSDLLEKAAKGG